MEAILDLAIGLTILAIGWALPRRAPRSPVAPTAIVRQLPEVTVVTRLVPIFIKTDGSPPPTPAGRDDFDPDGETHP